MTRPEVRPPATLDDLSARLAAAAAERVGGRVGERTVVHRWRTGGALQPVGLIDHGDGTVHVPAYAHQLVRAFLNGKVRRGRGRIADAAADRLLPLVSRMLVVIAHQSVHRVTAASGQQARELQSARTAPYAAALREGVAELFVQRHIGELLDAVGVTAIEPSVAQIPVESAAAAGATEAVAGLVSILAATLGTTEETELALLVRRGGTPVGVVSACDRVASGLPGLSAAERTLVSRAVQTAFTGPLTAIQAVVHGGAHRRPPIAERRRIGTRRGEDMAHQVRRVLTTARRLEAAGDPERRRQLTATLDLMARGGARELAA